MTYRLWSVRLDGVDARHVREIWVDTTRYTGDLEVRGDWVFRPLRWLEISHAVVDMHPLMASWGEVEPWVSGASGSLGVACEPTSLEAVRGAELLHRFSVAGAFGGVLHAANVVHRVAPEVGAFIGAAAFDAQIAIDRGLVGVGTDLRVRPFDARVRVTDLVLAASLLATARVDKEGLGAVTLEVDHVDVSQGGFARGRVTRVVVTSATHDLDLVHPFADATYAVDVAGARTESLRFWRTRLLQSPGVYVDSGTATASAHVQGKVAARTVTGQFDVEVRDALVKSGDATLTASRAALHVSTAHLSFPDRSGGPEVRGEGELSLRDLHGTYRGAAAVVSTLWARAKIDASASGWRGMVSLGSPDVEVPSLPRLAQLVPLGPLSVDAGSARGELAAKANLDSGVLEGSLRLTTRGLQARLGSRMLRGNLELAVKARRNADQTDLSGTRLVFTGDPGLPETDWWARAEASAAVLRMGQTPRLHAHLAGSAKDGSPLVVALSESTGVPKLLMDMVSTRALEVSGELVVAPSTFEARSVRARGDGFDAAFEYAALGAEKRWALALDLGLVRVGIHSADDRTEVVLFNVQPWFDARVASLRSTEPAVPP